MIDNKLLKDYLINATALGYDIHEAIELGYNIKSVDDISEALAKLRNTNELYECYYKKVTLNEVIELIKNSKGVTKHTLLKTLERQLKNIKGELNAIYGKQS